jgi:site-specific recombinase XerD
MRFHDLRHSCASLLLANGVPLKQIQDWLGHSDFAITANTYAHLDYNSKLASAGAMSWIENTSLASEMKPTTPVTLPPDIKIVNQEIFELPDFIQSLIVSGISSEVIQAWLKQADLSGKKSYTKSFSEFQSHLSVQ